METITKVWFADERIYICNNQGDVLSRPLEAFPLLKEATKAEREQFVITLHGTALRWDNIDEDIHISNFYETEEPDTDNEIARIFHSCPWLNVSEVARSIGINKSLLSKYIYGIKKPSEERLMQIKTSLHAWGKQLASV